MVLELCPRVRDTKQISTNGTETKGWNKTLLLVYDFIEKVVRVLYHFSLDIYDDNYLRCKR